MMPGYSKASRGQSGSLSSESIRSALADALLAVDSPARRDPCLKDRIHDFEAWNAEGTIWNTSSVHVISVTRV